MRLDDSITKISGIGEKKAKYFEKMKVKTIRDLIFHFPIRYEDRSNFKKISQIANDERVASFGRIISFEKTMPRKKMTITKIHIEDDNENLSLVFFNNEYIINKFSIGDKVAFYGKAKRNFGRLEMLSPELEKFGENKLIGSIYPIYPQTNGLHNNDIFSAIKKIINIVNVEDLEILPKEILEKQKIAPIKLAIKNIHFPESKNYLQISRYRFIYEDFFVLQMYMLMMKNISEKQKSYPLKPILEEEFYNFLEFELTNAQKKVISDIKNDMQRTFPMQRLVQGDVGSGKTVVAFFAMYMAYKNLFQSAIMVPTEILAKQHFETAKKIFVNQNINIRILLGSTSKKEKEEIYKEIESGECDIVIGTHSLIQSKVKFKNLAVAITDEQHRFGVKQRSMLYAEYEKTPHILVMTATPIPRTLAFILQGDLDISTINELPKGRQKVQTIAVFKKQKNSAYKKCLEEIEKGRQVYIVCPLVEESEKLDLESAEKLFIELKNSYFKNYKVAILHGKMKANEKTEIMQNFKDKKIDVLISTTVIEVGINVPNATVMVVEESQRFGLSQLHQLRGRVGRGSEKSYCILIYNETNEITRQRIETMCETNDGFLISQKDLEIRGPGELFGIKQHGLPEFRIADLSKHINILETAQKDAKEIIEKNILEEESKLTLFRKINDKFENEIKEIALN